MQLPNDKMIAREEVAERECSLQPEFRLMLAVLEDAVLTFQYGLRSRNPLRRRRLVEVEEWIISKETDSPFSFENICSVLRLDPDCIRAGLRRLKHQAQNDPGVLQRLRIRRRVPLSSQRAAGTCMLEVVRYGRRPGRKTVQPAAASDVEECVGTSA